MKKKLIVAVATVLVLANGASVAFADTGSGSTNIPTTIADGSEKTKLADAQKAAYKAEKAAYKVKRVAILETFHAAMESAKDTFKSAKESATTDEAKKAAESAFKTAVSKATQIKSGALKALGLKPVKPELNDEEKAAYKAEKAAFKAKRVAILETFRAAKESAKDTFKTAKESAATDEAKDAAKSAFKTAVSNATQIKSDALKALGFNSGNSGKSDGDK